MFQCSFNTTGIVSLTGSAPSIQCLCTRSIHNVVLRRLGNHNSKFPVHWDWLTHYNALESKKKKGNCSAFLLKLQASSLPIFPAQTKWLRVCNFLKRKSYSIMYSMAPAASTWKNNQTFACSIITTKDWKFKILSLFIYKDVTFHVHSWLYSFPPVFCNFILNFLFIYLRRISTF